MSKHYVDYVNGDDAADGKTLATAWKHLPGDPAAPTERNDVGGSIVVDGTSPYRLEQGPLNPLSGVVYSALDASVPVEIDLLNELPRGIDSVNGEQWSMYHFNFRRAKLLRGTPGVVRIYGGRTIILHRVGVFETEHYAEIPTDNGSIRCDHDAFRISDGSSNIALQHVMATAVGRTAIALSNSVDVRITCPQIGIPIRAVETGEDVYGFFSVAVRIAPGTSAVRIDGGVIQDGDNYEGDDPDPAGHAGDWFHVYGRGRKAEQRCTKDGPHDIRVSNVVMTCRRRYKYRNGSGYFLIENGAWDVKVTGCIGDNPHAAFGFVQWADEVTFEANRLRIYEPTVAGQITAFKAGKHSNKVRFQGNEITAYGTRSRRTRPGEFFESSDSAVGVVAVENIVQSY